MEEVKRKRLSNFRRLEVAYKQKYQCALCQILLPPRFQIDHIQALHCGGTNALSNLQALCGTCHDVKSGKEMSDLGDKQRGEKTKTSKYFDIQSDSFLGN
jgi:5-methylcytosine-specific restriction endonuclease McrA